MSLQEEELVSSHAGQPEQASSLLDQIMAQTRIQPGSEGYDVARQGVTAFIASILQSTASAEPVNKLVVDSMIADIDERISRQMDVIIHAPAFQQVESFWRSLKTMVDRVDFRENIKVNVLHVTKQELLEDFEFAPEIIQSGFYKHVYSSGFGQFGGEPIAAVLGAYEFKNTAPDMKLLQYVSAVGAMAHAPFLSSVSPEFMGLNSWTELPNIKDLYAIFEGPAYTKWRALRDSEDSRYLGLTAPRFLLRQPYPASPSVGTCPRLAERKARAPAAERDYSDTRFTRSAYRRQTPPRASVTDAAQPLAGYTPASSLPVTGLRGTHPA